MADPHKEAIAALSAQIDHYLATGKRIQDIPAGASGEVNLHATSNHPKQLRAKRDAQAPQVSDLAAQGLRSSMIAKAMGLDSRTVQRIAKENGITLVASN